MAPANRSSADAARRWAQAWRTCWERLDTEPIVALYADDAVLSTEPFREPYLGQDRVRTYVARVFAEEEDPHVNVAEPIVDGDLAAVSWWASLREDHVDTTLAGTSVLRFDPEGLVAEQWDTWNVLRERRRPPSDWGPFR
jgi:ketosteroid isomerase-like protein